MSEPMLWMLLNGTWETDYYDLCIRFFWIFNRLANRCFAFYHPQGRNIGKQGIK